LGREGTVVEFSQGGDGSWTGNFEPGIEGATDVLQHPDEKHVIVISRGDVWVVDPNRRLADRIAYAVDSFWPVSSPDGFVFSRQGLAFFRLVEDGVRWHTRRLSWDGFDKVEVDPTTIRGLAWNAVVETSQTFEVDLKTGASMGGAYDLEDTEGWERLAN
jgi:hypothetical protein